MAIQFFQLVYSFYLFVHNKIVVINYRPITNKRGIMPKIFSVLFIVLFSFSAFAQSSLIEFGDANVSGTSTYEPSLAPVVLT